MLSFGMALFGRSTYCKQHCDHKYILFGLLSKVKASLMRNNFSKRPSGAPLHTLSELYDGSAGFVKPFTIAEGWLLLDTG